MSKETYDARTFQKIPTGMRGKIEYPHPESDLALALDLPPALQKELKSLCDDIGRRIDAGSLDEGAVGLIDLLASDVARLAHAQTSLEDVRRRRVHLVKRASAAKREVLDGHMARLDEYAQESLDALEG